MKSDKDYGAICKKDRHSRCGNCVYHEPTFIWSEGVCENPESTYYKCYTDRFAYCKRFEEKEDAEEENDG